MSWYNGYDDDFEEDDYTLSEYTRPPEAIVLEGPLQATSKRGPIGVEWWGQQWVATLENLGYGGRLDRGKRYARNGSVLNIDINHGLAFARVQGSFGYAYRSAVHLKILDEKQWKKALQALSGQAIYAAKLLAGEMPGDIETVFQSVGLSLFPQSAHDIQFECSCPDWSEPCKHTAAVYYLLAEQLDVDPFMLFHLRGKSREAVLAQLRGYRGDAEPVIDIQPETEEAQPLDADLEKFWRSSDVELVRAMPVRGQEPFVLRQLGEPPGGLGRELGTIYVYVANEAARWLGLDDDVTD
jgi:uncharacterized Zn finger protein